MSVLTAATLISTHGAIWNYPGCWHEIYPHIHMSTWPTCWPNIKLMPFSVILGHQMDLPGSIRGYVWWQASLTHWLTIWQADLWCCYWGVCLMTGQPDPLVDQMASWPEMPLPGYIWLMSIWPQVYMTNVVTHMATRCFCLEGGSGWHFVLGSQPANQLASCNRPANQPCHKISTCQALGWSDMWWQEDWKPDHIGPQSRVPALPPVPLGEWPTWPKPGKWHKWALQPVIYFGTMLNNHLQFCIYAT